MSVHPRAGTPADSRDTIDVPRVVMAYYTEHPDPDVPEQRVAFGTSGHRGSSLRTAFNEDHIVATSQAIVEYRRDQGIDGPLFLVRDTHALSEPAMVSALEVFAANDVNVLIDSRDGYTPTPALSHAILTYNRGRTAGLADGVVVTPSHNPPDDGGFKYNPPHGGPADTDATTWIQDRANALIAAGLKEVRRVPYARARARRRPPARTTTWPPTSTTCPRCSTSTRSARPGSGSAPTRWAAPASPTGARSPTGTAST